MVRLDAVGVPRFKDFFFYQSQLLPDMVGDRWGSSIATGTVERTNDNCTDVSKNVLRGGCTAKHKDMANDIEVYHHQDTKKKQNTDGRHCSETKNIPSIITSRFYQPTDFGSYR